MLDNASYFAFTATPKNKTLELFGEASPQPDGAVRHLPFHIYSMKQAIQEGFILDVLENYTSIRSYFNLVKKIDEDPEFDSRRAQRRLRHYVEGHEYAVRSKAEIMVDHFHESIFSPQLMGAKARAMVVTGRRGPRHRLLPGHERIHPGEGTALPGHHRLLGGAGPQRGPGSAKHS